MFMDTDRFFNSTHEEHGGERGERRRSPAGDADSLDALENGYAEEVNVGRTMELLPQVLRDEVEQGVLFCVRNTSAGGRGTNLLRALIILSFAMHPFRDIGVGVGLGGS